MKVTRVDDLPVPSLESHPWQIREWLNCAPTFDLAEVSGRVLVVEAFQLLCPGCVARGLPQMQRVHEQFAGDDLAVIGLHTVFEHHTAQGQTEVLKAFLHENRLTFPIGIDEPSPDGPIPHTMHTYQLQGTPSLLLFDRAGRLRLSHFGVVDDLALGFSIATLLNESTPVTPAAIQRFG